FQFVPRIHNRLTVIVDNARSDQNHRCGELEFMPLLRRTCFLTRSKGRDEYLIAWVENIWPLFELPICRMILQASMVPKPLYARSLSQSSRVRQHVPVTRRTPLRPGLSPAPRSTIPVGDPFKGLPPTPRTTGPGNIPVSKRPVEPRPAPRRFFRKVLLRAHP